MSTWDEGVQEWRRARELADLSADQRAWIAGHYPEERLDVTTHEGLSERHMMAVEDDEPRPEETPGASPTWFVIAFVLALICCGSTACGVLIAWIAGAFS